MKIIEKFYFFVGILLLYQGILGILFFNIHGDVGFIVFGTLLTILGIVTILISIRLLETISPPPLSPWGVIPGAISFLFIGILFLFGNILFYYYLSGLFLSWGATAIFWILVKLCKKRDKDFEPKLDIIESSEIPEEEIKQDLKNAEIDPTGQIQMIINICCFLKEAGTAEVCPKCKAHLNFGGVEEEGS